MTEQKRSLLVLSLLFIAIILVGITYSVTMEIYESKLTTANARIKADEVPAYTPSQMLSDINSTRKGLGIPTLEESEFLDASASLKLQDMVVNHYYDHPNPKTGKQGDSYIVDLTDNGCTQVAENLNMLPDSANPVTDSYYGWNVSAEHYATEINPKYSLVGLAGARAWNGEFIYVAHFCEPR